jgi:hypothetical protein
MPLPKLINEPPRVKPARGKTLLDRLINGLLKCLLLLAFFIVLSGFLALIIFLSSLRFVIKL